MFEKHVGEIFRELMRSFLQKYRMVFCKNTDMWIPEILRGLFRSIQAQKYSGLLQRYLGVFYRKAFYLQVFYKKAFCKNTDMQFAEIWTRLLQKNSEMQKYSRLLQRYREVFCRNTYRCSVDILRGVLQRYLDAFCRDTERCSVDILRGVLWKYLDVFCRNTQRCSAK